MGYLGTATWDRKKKLFDIKQILISSKYTINHIEVDSLDKIEDYKTKHNIFYIFTKLSPCDNCFQILRKWTKNNKFNMIIFGFKKLQEVECYLLQETNIPNNFLIFDL